jgi:hypothetical protein
VSPDLAVDLFFVAPMLLVAAYVLTHLGIAVWELIRESRGTRHKAKGKRAG